MTEGVDKDYWEKYYEFWDDFFAFLDAHQEEKHYQFDWVEVIDPEYAIYGQLIDGTYFMAGGYRDRNSEEPMVSFTNTNPEEFYDFDLSAIDDEDEEWLAMHVILELSHPENLKFWEDLRDYCEENGYWV